MKQKKIVLLLTACVNPKGMIYTKIQDVDERLEQYEQALDFYLNNTSFDIVIVENTGYDFAQMFHSYMLAGRLECLTFQGNDYNRNLGKGYGETSILEYAYMHSEKIAKSDMVVKITGRVIVKNINAIIQKCKSSKAIYIDYYRTDLSKFAAVLFFVDKKFLVCLSKFKTKLNDSKGYYFEHSLRDAACLYSSEKKVEVFPVCPIYDGYSGSLGKKYDNTTPLRWFIKRFLWKIKYRRSLVNK